MDTHTRTHILTLSYTLTHPQISAAESSKKETSKALVKEMFESRYKAGKNKWFFQKLRF